MENMFSAKVRQVGTSLGVLIPKEAIAAEEVQAGEVVQVSILKQKRDLRDILRLFGGAKGAKPFIREHADREF